MGSLALHAFHQANGARFLEFDGQEAVTEYGDEPREHAALIASAGLVDLGLRGRLCLLGADRVKFLNGQVTNNVKDLQPGDGCHAALVSAKGKIQADLHIYILENEILLDFDSGMREAVQRRLEKYIIAEDVQIADACEVYGLLTLQGFKAAEVLAKLPWQCPVPAKTLSIAKVTGSPSGELYIANRPRTSGIGYDLFVPNAALETMASQLVMAGARLCGWNALEVARIEAGIPRFGVDMNETNLAPEVFDASAISYSKGCYIGQEVIARVRTYGQVAKALRGLRLPDQVPALPKYGDKLFLGDKEAGYITSVTCSLLARGFIALGYVRREANQIGTELTVHIPPDKIPVRIVDLPFVPRYEE